MTMPLQTETSREIEETLGRVPSFMERLPSAVAENEWRSMRDFSLQDTAIPMKYKELIGLAVASAIQCPYCTYFHEAAARLNGASDEELAEALYQGKDTAGWSTFIRGGNQSLQEFKEEVDAIVAHVRAHAPTPASRDARPRAR